MTELALTLPAEVVDAIAERAAQLVLEQLATLSRDDGSEWIHGDKALAAYLGWPLGRVQKKTAAGVIPCHRVGQRKSYKRAEVDRALDEHYEGPPRLRSVS